MHVFYHDLFFLFFLFLVLLELGEGCCSDECGGSIFAFRSKEGMSDVVIRLFFVVFPFVVVGWIPCWFALTVILDVSLVIPYSFSNVINCTEGLSSSFGEGGIFSFRTWVIAFISCNLQASPLVGGNWDSFSSEKFLVVSSIFVCRLTRYWYSSCNVGSTCFPFLTCCLICSSSVRLFLSTGSKIFFNVVFLSREV